MPQFFDLDDRLASLKEEGKPLVCLSKRVNFERFRRQLKRLLKLYYLSRKGGRPPFNPVLMFKILILQSLYNLSDDQTEYQIRGRLSFMHFLGLTLRMVSQMRRQFGCTGNVCRRGLSLCLTPLLSI